MINIVTGRINSGKTSKLAAMYQFNNEGDGFVAVKEMKQGIVTEYRVMHLSTMEHRPFLFRDTFAPADFDACFGIGPYLVSLKGLTWIETEIRRMIGEKKEPIYLDEIGPLELEDKGFHPIFMEMLASGLELYITVRSELVDKVVTKYHIGEYRLM